MANRFGPVIIGPLEREVLDVIWEVGEADVSAVLPRLSMRRAYTTVMTTLNRLVQKGLLNRRKGTREYIYCAVQNRDELERERVAEFVKAFVNADGRQSHHIRCLIDLACETDESILDALERSIQLKREELERKRGFS